MSRNNDKKYMILEAVVGIIQILVFLPIEFFKLIGSIFKE